MRLILGLLSYLIAAVAIVSGAAAFLSYAVEPGTRMPAQQETPKVAPRVQAWLDRKAEGLVYAEKEKAAAFAEKERGLRINVAVEQAAPAQLREAAERESATRARESAKREARRSRQLEQTEARAAYGYVPEPARSSGPRLHGPE
jgi:hypothetical protein